MGEREEGKGRERREKGNEEREGKERRKGGTQAIGHVGWSQQ